MDRDRFLLASNAAARLNRRQLFARIADHERNAKSAARMVHGEQDESTDERLASLVEEEVQEHATPASNALSQKSNGSQSRPRLCMRRLAAQQSLTAQSSPGSQSYRKSDKSGQADKSGSSSSPLSPGQRKGSQTERSNRPKDDSLPPVVPARICSETTLFSVTKIIPGSPREIQKSGSPHFDSPEVRMKMQATREAFVERAKYYLGTLYRPSAKRRDGQSIGPGGCSDRLFLDCCGLIRQCVRDLKSEFGFDIGPWNQAYQMDTLPIALEADQMQPGDLVFVQGRYHDRKKRRPRNDIVHVEIFLGGSTGQHPSCASSELEAETGRGSDTLA